MREDGAGPRRAQAGEKLSRARFGIKFERGRGDTPAVGTVRERGNVRGGPLPRHGRVVELENVGSRTVRPVRGGGLLWGCAG